MNPTEEALVPGYKRQRNQAPLIIRKQLKRLLLAFIMSEGEQSPKQAFCQPKGNQQLTQVSSQYTGKPARNHCWLFIHLSHGRGQERECSVGYC